MSAHSERLAKFEETVYRQREEMQEKMAEMMSLLKEYTKTKAPEKVLVRKESQPRITKYVNAISIFHKDENEVVGHVNNGEMRKMSMKTWLMNDKYESIRKGKSCLEKETHEKLKRYKGMIKEAPISHPVEYYLKHDINKKTIDNLKNNYRYNDSLRKTMNGEIAEEVYDTLPAGPLYESLLKKGVAKKRAIYGNFEIPCSSGDLEYMNALADQGPDVKIMPLSIYKKLTIYRLSKTNLKLSLANHSYVYPIGIVEDVLIDVGDHIYLVDFVIVDVEEDECMPLILGTPFLATARATIDFGEGLMTLRAGKSKIRIYMVPRYKSKHKKKRKVNVDPITYRNHVKQKILRWEARIKNYKECESRREKWIDSDFKEQYLAEHNCFLYGQGEEDVENVKEGGVT